MSDTYTIDASLKLGTDTQITAALTIETTNSNIKRYTIAPSGALSFTSGTRATMISTNVSGSNTIKATYNGADHLIQSFTFLAGNHGTVVLTNTLAAAVEVEIATFNV